MLGQRLSGTEHQVAQLNNRRDSLRAKTWCQLLAETTRLCPEKPSPPKDIVREYPPITTISSPSRPVPLHSSHPQTDKRLQTRTSEKVISNVNSNGATVERQRRQALSFDTSSIPRWVLIRYSTATCSSDSCCSRSKSTVDVKKNRHRSHTPRRTAQDTAGVAQSSPGLFELPEEDNEHEKVKAFKHEKKAKSTPQMSLDDGYTPEEREGPLSSYSHIGEYDSGSDWADPIAGLVYIRENQKDVLYYLKLQATFQLHECSCSAASTSPIFKFFACLTSLVKIMLFIYLFD